MEQAPHLQMALYRHFAPCDDVRWMAPERSVHAGTKLWSLRPGPDLTRDNCHLNPLSIWRK
jgi:hypothetical protein